MASGCVIEYRGKRGRVFRIKYTDANGRQVMETLGREEEGWTKKQAKRALRDRLSDVDRKRYRKPKAVTFETYSETWLAEGQRRRAWKANTYSIYMRSLERLGETLRTAQAGGDPTASHRRLLDDAAREGIRAW